MVVKIHYNVDFVMVGRNQNFILVILKNQIVNKKIVGNNKFVVLDINKNIIINNMNKINFFI